MTGISKRPLGKTGLEVAEIGLGGGLHPRGGRRGTMKLFVSSIGLWNWG